MGGDGTFPRTVTRFPQSEPEKPRRPPCRGFFLSKPRGPPARSDLVQGSLRTARGAELRRAVQHAGQSAARQDEQSWVFNGLGDCLAPQTGARARGFSTK
jgi:hypothetical protein